MSRETIEIGGAGTRPLGDRLEEIIETWARSHYELVMVAAEFADTREWVLTRSPTAAQTYSNTTTKPLTNKPATPSQQNSNCDAHPATTHVTAADQRPWLRLGGEHHHRCA